MFETLATSMKSASTRGSAADTRVLAQVEKWMAVIRELSGTPRGGWPDENDAPMARDDH